MTAYLCTGAFILFDILTGILKAWKQKSINSAVLRTGLFNKLSEIVAIAFSAFLEFGGDEIHLGIDLPFVGVVSSYICLMEFISITENLCVLNPQFEKLFGKYLEKVKDKEEK